MAVLEIKGLNKKYKLGNKTSFQALTDINLSFKRGELVSIVGESGSGKSTLMNVVGGLDSDYEGSIIVNGENIKELNDKQLDEYRKKKIGFVFQSFNLIPHLTILDNVTIALTLSNVKESEKVKKATAILTRLGLESQIKKKPNQLSGGQKQRVAIARALINDPEIILADEPTGALDSDTTLQILEILKEIADDGKLVIMVTHSEKVASISSRVVELSDGKIVRDEQRKNYKKNKTKLIESVTNNNQKDDPKKKTNLSLWSALKLSFHNMWASKVKNLLISFGVSISLLSLILMLAFGSGLTDYIQSLANRYNDPLYVSITKHSQKSGSTGGLGFDTFLNPEEFNKDNENEVSELLDKIDNYLDESGYNKINRDNVSYGFSKVSYTRASFTYPADEEGHYDENGKTSEPSGIFYVYTTPPYYNESNMIAGKISGMNEIMFSKALIKTLGFETAEEVVNANVKLDIDLQNFLGIKTSDITGDDNDLGLTGIPTLSGIIDVSEMFQTLPILYVNYDYLQTLVKYINIKNQEKGLDQTVTINPTAVYIKTESKSMTKIISKYVDSLGDYSGAVEQQLAKMFTEMISIFSTALAIIAGISLLVAAIMILVVLYMSVTERTREIGVLKSIGARRKDIKRIFTSESFLIGVLSGIVGCILSLIAGGVIIIVLTAVLGMAPLSFRWWYFALAIAISIFISMVSGLLPAAKAAKLDPVESLRHE